MKRIILCCIFSFFTFFCFSQTNIRLSVVKGARVIFNFESSLKEIKNGKDLGIAPGGFSAFQINYKQDIDFSSLGWILTVRANTANLEPDFGTTSLNLDAINLSTYLDGIYQSTITLSSTDQTIAIKNISYPPLAALPENHTNEITIVYECGKSGQLIGLESDDFTTDLIFNVQSQ